MKTLESISLFINTIVFFQDDVSMVMLSHHSKDVLLYYPELSFFMSFLQSEKQIIRPTL